MADHGIHPVQVSRRMAHLCLQYPWSVLWVLTSALAAFAVAGEYLAVIILIGLQAVVLIHSIHIDRQRRRSKR